MIPILVLFLDRAWIFENLPVKSLGSNMSRESEAMRSRKMPSWSWPCSCSWSGPWLRERLSQWSEATLSAARLSVLPTSSRDMSPRSNPPQVVRTSPSWEPARRHYMMFRNGPEGEKSNTLWRG